MTAGFKSMPRLLTQVMYAFSSRALTLTSRHAQVQSKVHYSRLSARILICTELGAHWHLFVFVSILYVFVSGYVC